MEEARSLKKRLEELIEAVGLKDKRGRVEALKAESQSQSFWQNQEEAQKVMRQLSQLNEEVDKIDTLKKKIDTLEELLKEEGDGQESVLTREIAEIEKELTGLESAKFLSGPYDAGDAILSLHAGQGGTEAMDWTAMLTRMYSRWAEGKNYKVEKVSERPGEEAGIKSVTLTIEGRYAYGYLKRERGTHRLVRQSPFNADNLRQTSFALVEVLPVLENLTEVEIKSDDLQIEFFRSSGSGGQNVNKVATAVRLKHLPTGITVEAQTQRYQEQNRKTALKMLAAKLWEIEQEKRREKIDELKGEHQSASWGRQIRSYVLHPYKQVKDLRTNYTATDPEAVLDGAIDGFIEAELKLDLDKQ